MNPKDLAAVIAKLLAAETQVIAVAKELGPIASALPAPFNTAANPLVQEALAVLPKLTPFLTELEALLAGMPQSQPQQ